MNDEFHSPLFRSGVIVARAGYTVTLRSRYELEYVESNWLVTMSYDAATVDLDLLTESLEVWAGDRLVEPPPGAIARILKNVEAALTWKGFRVHLIESA